MKKEDDQSIDTKKPSSSDTQKSPDKDNMEGITFVDAIKERYSHILEEDSFSGDIETHIVSTRVVELVGMEKITKQIRQKPLTRLILDRRHITRVGTISPSLQKFLNSVTEVDLSFNEFRDWSTVVEIVSHLPSLKDLYLSSNTQLLPIRELSADEIHSHKTIMSHVERIILADCGYTWGSVVNMALNIWSDDLLELNLHRNEIIELNVLPSNMFNHLEILDLSSNDLRRWSVVCYLGNLPKLKSLNISDCKIDTIFIDVEDGGKTDLFKSLECLSFRNNRLETWLDVAQFNKFANLKALNLKGNPVIEREKDYVRAFNLILGRVGGLQVLNHETITEEMMRDGEIYYLRAMVKIGIQPDNEDWLEENPRFMSLAKEFTESVDATPAKPKNVSLHLMSDDGNRMTKRLPLSMTIPSLKVMMKRLFKIDASDDVTLTWKSKEDTNFSYQLTDENDLNFYDVSEEDSIIISRNSQ